MLDVVINLIRNPNYEKLSKTIKTYDWFGDGLRQRLPLLVFLLAFQCLYFPINQIHEGGFTANIPAIDSKLPLIPEFVVAYVMSILLMPLFPLYAAWKFPRELFREYMVAFFAIMVMGYTLWILIPAYVEKQPVKETGYFANMVEELHEGDEGYGTHNALPSSHVYYMTLAICYYILYNKKLFWPGVIFAAINGLSTMFTHQHYFLDVVAGLLLTAVAYELSKWVLVPALVKREAALLES